MHNIYNDQTLAQNLWLYLPKYTNKCHVMALTIIIAIKTPTPKIAETHKFSSHFTRILPLFVCPFTHIYLSSSFLYIFPCFFFHKFKVFRKVFPEKINNFAFIEIYLKTEVFYRVTNKWYFALVFDFFFLKRKEKQSIKSTCNGII